MTLLKYYSQLLRRGDGTGPTLEEEQRDFQRVVALSSMAYGFYD
jgi:hypothetical protein